MNTAPAETTPSPSPSRAPGPAATRHKAAKEYETIYILRSDIDAEGAERVQARVSDAVERERGKLVKAEAWGRRKLAYPIGKQRKGVYVYFKYVGGGGLVAEVERNLKLQDAVVKFMTVQTKDEVDLEQVQIDPEETKLGKLELAAEEEKEESREKQLGLIDLGPEAPRSSRAAEGPEGEEEFEGEDAFDAATAERAKPEVTPGGGSGEES